MLVKKILVALDGSKSAKHALNFALELAKITSAELELLTVAPPVFCTHTPFTCLNQKLLQIVLRN